MLEKIQNSKGERKIMECLRISNKEYRAREGISSTELKKIMKR